jgi:hypothetical protein
MWPKMGKYTLPTIQCVVVVVCVVCAVWCGVVRGVYVCVFRVRTLHFQGLKGLP